MIARVIQPILGPWRSRRLGGWIPLFVALAACGPKSSPRPITQTATHPASGTERMLALLPDGAQIIFELDLARLRKNAVVGPVVTRVLEAAATGGPLPAGVPASPLAGADALVMAAYAVGTPRAATITLVVTRADVAGARRLAADLVALGPPEWIDQIQTRAAIAGVTPAADAAPANVSAPAELLALRDRAMPQGAPGASLRLTARLSFDARVSLAQQTGIDAAPAQLSVWGDVVDDIAIVVDADAADPGERNQKAATARMTTAVRRALGLAANVPAIRALGVIDSLESARVVPRGSWVRTIIAIGPEHLKRAMVRANDLLGKP